MATKLGFIDYKATDYIVKDSKYTGEKIPMWDSVSKNTAIQEYVKNMILILKIHIHTVIQVVTTLC